MRVLMPLKADSENKESPGDVVVAHVIEEKLLHLDLQEPHRVVVVEISELMKALDAFGLLSVRPRMPYMGTPSRIIDYTTPDPRRYAPPPPLDFIVETREAAEKVIKAMHTLSDKGQVSVADLKMLVGLPTDHSDYQWGWAQIINTKIEVVDGGFRITVTDPLHPARLV